MRTVRKDDAKHICIFKRIVFEISVFLQTQGNMNDRLSDKHVFFGEFGFFGTAGNK